MILMLSFRVKGSKTSASTKDSSKESNTMKKSIRFTSAAMAALIAMSCAAFSAFADDSTELADDSGYTEFLAGGWEVNTGSTSISKNAAAKAAFKKATAELLGVSYQPIAVLGTQVVAGTKYAILCKATPVIPDAAPDITIMYIYENVDGTVDIDGFQTIISGGDKGGFKANTGKFTIKNKKNKAVYSAYKKAMKELVGVDYKPVLYLGKQTKSGSSYMILCRSQAVYPNAPYEWSLVTVSKSAKGKVKLGDVQTLELGNTDEEITGDNTQIPNPWQEYKTVSEAAKATGISFSAPEKIEKYTVSYVRALDGIVEVRYSNGSNEIRVRKGKGTDDISGDYNVYKNVSEKKIGGNTVTLKGNGDGVSSATWTDGTYSCSIFSENELTNKLVESIVAAMR
jgi:hypothetical protein